jgi:transcriptional regulator with XRE-family HTH domain
MTRRPLDLNPSSSPLALFGSELRRYREMAGLSQEQLGAKIQFSRSLVGDVERGEKRPDRAFAVACDGAMDTLDALTHLWDGLLKKSAYPSWFADWPLIEARAVTLRQFQPQIVHGLLQTEGYARGLLYGDEEAVAARMARQEILTRAEPPPPRLVCLLDEAVLHRRLGGAEVMRDQLKHLTGAGSPRLGVQVVPSGTVHPGDRGAFVIATLADGDEVAYLETAARGLITTSRDDLRALGDSWETIRAQALPVTMSVDLITRTAEEKWT